MDTEKLISYFKERYGEEVDRFNHIESKSSVILRFLTILLGVIAATASFHKTIFHPTSCAEWVILLIYVSGTISVVISWAYSLYSLRISNCPIIPKSKKVYEYLSAVSNEDGEKYILDGLIDTTEILGNVINSKARYLRYAYNSLAISAVHFILLSLITAIIEVTK